MEGPLEEQETDQKVKSLSGDNKVKVVQVAADGDTTATDIPTDAEHVSESALVSDVSSSPNEFNDAMKADEQVHNTVDLELKEDEEEERAFVSHHHEPEGTNGISQVAVSSEDKNQLSSVSANEASTETEVVETVNKDVMVSEEDKNLLSSVIVADVVSKETLEPLKDEEVEDVQDQSYAGPKESFPLENVLDAESTTGVTLLQNETQVPRRSTENQNIVYVTQRQSQYTSWKSCCGIFEILRRADR